MNEKKLINSIDDPFRNLLETDYKKNILSLIKYDILDEIQHISLIELEYLANNIYDYCCLVVNDISKEDIENYLNEKFSLYYDSLSDTDKKKFNKNVGDNVKDNVKDNIRKKYIDEIKNKYSN